MLQSKTVNEIMEKTIIATIERYTNEALDTLDDLSFFVDRDKRDIAFGNVDILKHWGNTKDGNLIEEDLLSVCSKPEEMQQYFSLMLAQMPKCTILNKYDEKSESYRNRFDSKLAEQAEELIEWFDIALDRLWYNLLQIGKKYGLENPYEEEWLNELRGTQDQPQDATNTTEPQQLIDEKLQTRKRGRPKEPFSSKMIDDANGDKLKKMHKVLAGKKCKDFALLLWACIQKGWCNKPTYTQAKEEFGDIGSKTSYNRCINNVERMYTEDERKGVLSAIDGN